MDNKNIINLATYKNQENLLNKSDSISKDLTQVKEDLNGGLQDIKSIKDTIENPKTLTYEEILALPVKSETVLISSLTIPKVLLQINKPILLYGYGFGPWPQTQSSVPPFDGVYVVTHAQMQASAANIFKEITINDSPIFNVGGISSDKANVQLRDDRKLELFNSILNRLYIKIGSSSTVLNSHYGLSIVYSELP